MLGGAGVPIATGRRPLRGLQPLGRHVGHVTLIQPRKLNPAESGEDSSLSPTLLHHDSIHIEFYCLLNCKHGGSKPRGLLLGKSTLLSIVGSGAVGIRTDVV